MGLYDTYENVQLKVGNVSMRSYNIGDKVDINDGVYIALEGAVVIVNGIFVGVFGELINKWGGKIQCSEVLK